MFFVIIWLFDHLMLEPVPSVNGVWIITFVKKFKPSFMFFQLLVLISNNVVWVNFFAVLFDEARHVVKTSAVEYVPVCYEIINLFIKPQNFILMLFVCKLKGFYLIVLVSDGVLILSLDLFNSCIKPRWYDIFQDMLLKCFTLVFLRFYNDIHDPKD